VSSFPNSIRDKVVRVLAPVARHPSASQPSSGFLVDALNKAVSKTKGETQVQLAPEVARAFSTAAVDMWDRSVHSFLISCSLADCSPIWASVAGYYSSHYAVRAIAHALGIVQLFRQKKVVYLLDERRCEVSPRRKEDREHVFYWRKVKDHEWFSLNPLFTRNLSDGSATDAGHREKANYLDHIPISAAPTFSNGVALREKVRRISMIHFSDPPIPRPDRYPDIVSAQVVAYHRLITFRRLLDDALGTSNRYWNARRNPGWANDLMDFQVSSQAGLGVLSS